MKNEQIFSMEEYMIWIENFTKKHNTWNSESGCPIDSTEEDKENLIKIKYFFKVICDYSLKNNNFPVCYKFTEYNHDELVYNFYIKYNKNLYEFGVTYGQRFAFSFRKMKDIENLEFIDFCNMQKDIALKR